jgi:N-acetylneuraminate synthase/N,N'-diacetyllegionaminate synthase
VKKDKVFIIAEAGVNHNGDLSLAFQMIDEAVKAQVDAIKYQLYVSGNLVTSSLPMSEYQKENMNNNSSQLEMLQQYELAKEDLEKLIKYAEKKGILLIATPFDRGSVDALVALERPYIKVDSGAITDHPFLEYIAMTGIPLIVSTGASTMDEVREAVAVIEKHNRNITLLHCTAMYPAPYNRVNLFAIKEMINEFAYPIGYSDHTLGIEVPIAAVAMGARVIEKHFTLDRSLEGPDHDVSLEPDELAKMVQSIRHIEQALGESEKKPFEEEVRIMETGRHSIIAAMNLKKGQRLTERDVVIKRPGTGIPPKYLKTVIGGKVLHDIEYDSPIMETDIERIESDR